MTLSAGIVGATGYVGQELVRWCQRHPRLTLRQVVSPTRAGAPLSQVVPALQGCCDLQLQPFEARALAALDVVLLATPHGATAPLAKALDAAGAPLVIDLSADHRHAPGWVYGQPEWHANELAGAERIAAPGCFATAISLALAPLVAVGAVQGAVQVCAATGSTGSGARPGAATHHPDRFANLRAYKVLQHQHVPEVRAFLAGLGPAPTLHFVPLSAPVDRGIFATCFVPVPVELDAAAIVVDAYAAAPLVRVRSRSPELGWVRGTGFCDLSLQRDGACTVVLVAIDNLGRGAAAQAMQCLNLARGWPVATGLMHPVAA